MLKPGPIILIDDDPDDKDLIKDVLQELNVTNKLITFADCHEAMEYLKTTKEQAFLILCDINLPGQSGIEFKMQIDANSELRGKCIPFVFYSTSGDPEVVRKAYTDMTVQGFFQKANNYTEVKKNIKTIIEYWKECKHPVR
ncbi:MAG: response regulator receiver protein [Chitinophagaceae bacterium]|nr:response regulator receiver protein [Chitinophagaceae bacterium]